MKRNDILLMVMLLATLLFGALMAILGYMISQEVRNGNYGVDTGRDIQVVCCCDNGVADSTRYNCTPQAEDICKATATPTPTVCKTYTNEYKKYTATPEGCYIVCPPTATSTLRLPTHTQLYESTTPPRPTNTDAPPPTATAVPPTSVVLPTNTDRPEPTGTEQSPDLTPVAPTATDVPPIFCHCEQGEGAEGRKNCHPAQYNPGHAKHEWDYWSDDGTCDGWHH